MPFINDSTSRLLMIKPAVTRSGFFTATLFVVMMLFSSMSPILTVASAHLGHPEHDNANSNANTWGLSGSEDTGWVTLESIGASPTNNQPGYANWELNFAPGAIVSNVSLQVGVDGSNGIYAMNPELYSPSTQYSFFDWSENGGFGYQEGFLNGDVYNLSLIHI